MARDVTGKIIDLPVDRGTPVTAGKTVLARGDDVWSGSDLVFRFLRRKRKTRSGAIGHVSDKAIQNKAIGFLIGQVMQGSAGKANPKVIGEMLLQKLGASASPANPNSPS